MGIIRSIAVLLAVPIALGIWSTGAKADALGHGVFLGTWAGNVCQGDCDETDPPSNPFTYNELEQLIRTAFPSTSPFDELGNNTPEQEAADPLFNSLNGAGKLEDDINGTDKALIFTNGGNLSGSWEYDADLVAGRPLADEIVDLYFVMKYAGWFSVSYFGEVEDGDTGQWSVDPNAVASNYVDPFGNAVGVCDSPYFGNNGGGFEDGTYAGLCLNAKSGSPGSYTQWGISHVEGLWPGLNPIPVPAALPLLLSGIVGLGFMSRRTRKQA